MKKRKIPLRMCVGCREMHPKKNLIRIVKNKEGEIFIDDTGKKNGRGAYLCKNLSCLEKAFKIKALNKAFEMSIESCLEDNIRLKMEEFNDK